MPAQARHQVQSKPTMMLLTSESIKSLLSLLFITWAVVAICTATYVQTGTGEDRTSSVELADLLHTETVIIENLRNYVNALDAKISAIKKKTEEIRAIYDVALNNTEKYFGNPINTFNLIKRMTYDWIAMRNFAGQDVTGHIIENITVFSEFLTFPTEQDMDEVVAKLLKIQDVYQMESSQVAMGEFNGMKFGSEMTWSDCFAIGQQSFKQGEHLVAKLWLQTALEKLSATVESAQSKNAKVEILETLADSEYQSGNLKESLRLTEDILEINPKVKRAIARRAKLTQKVKRKTAKPKITKPKKSTEELLNQEVCRGASEQYTSSSFRRICTYVNGNIPYLRIGPIKWEALSEDPFVALYHNILSGTEIERFKGFLRDGTGSNVFAKLEKVTGYRVEKFREWTSVRSCFEDEIDFQQTKSLATKNAKSTGVLWIQLNRPKLGGDITFPQLEMRVDVPKGSLLYWSTMNEFNEVDYRTKDFICPVVAGTLEAARTSVRLD